MEKVNDRVGIGNGSPNSGVLSGAISTHPKRSLSGDQEHGSYVKALGETKGEPKMERNFRCLVIDFKCKRYKNETLSTLVLADFLFNIIGLRKE